MRGAHAPPGVENPEQMIERFHHRPAEFSLKGLGFFQDSGTAVFQRQNIFQFEIRIDGGVRPFIAKPSALEPAVIRHQWLLSFPSIRDMPAVALVSPAMQTKPQKALEFL